MYKILKLYNKRENKKEDQEKNFNFLLRNLDKKDRSASVLFEVFDFGKNARKYIDQLIQNYSDKFDFSYIKLQLCKIITDQKKMKKNKLYWIVLCLKLNFWNKKI